MCRCSTFLVVSSLEFLSSRTELSPFLGSEFVELGLVSARTGDQLSILLFVSSRTLTSLFGATHAFVSSLQSLAVSLIFLIFFE